MMETDNTYMKELLRDARRNAEHERERMQEQIDVQNVFLELLDGYEQLQAENERLKSELEEQKAEVDSLHRQRGWKGIGYHFVVLPDGTVEAGRPIDETGAHCIGDSKHPNMNPVSIGVCYVGGLDQDGQPADTRTEAQKRSLRQLIQGLRYTYPQAKVYGHRDFDSRKACPCFDARAEYN